MMVLPTAYPLLTYVVVGALGWLLWRVIKNFFITSPLDKIPGPKSGSFINGNLGQIMNRHSWATVDELGSNYHGVSKIAGQFGSRVLYVFDPLALYHIVVKDVDTFGLPEWNVDGLMLTLGHNLISLQGEEHRRERKMMVPAFSIKNMRAMTSIFYDVAHKMRSALIMEVGDGPTTVDILHWISRTALELVGQGALGYSLDSLDKGGQNEYAHVLKIFAPLLMENSRFQYFLKYTKHIGTPAFRAAMIDWLPFPQLKRLKETVIKMDAEARRIYHEKKRHLQSKYTDTGAEDVDEDQDIISNLIRDNIAASDKDHLTDEEIIGQMSLLVEAGIDTTSNALTQIVQLLAQYPEVQERLRSEIKKAQQEHEEDIPYNILVDLPYLDAICRESLRLYTPVSTTFREANKDVILPLSEPITCTDGTTMNEIPVPAGTMLILGLRSSNRCKDIWGDDALEFKPERWLSPLPSTVMEAKVPGVYSHLMTFNGGSRSCIGFKFSQLEMKVVLAVLISTFRISFSKESHDVIWNFAAVRYPTIGKDSTKPEFPLTLERLKV